MSAYNFTYPDIPYLESREMYDYFLLLDKTTRSLGDAINSIGKLDPETVARLVLPRVDGITLQATNGVWSVVRAPVADFATEADHASAANNAAHATNADEATNAVNANHADTATKSDSADKLTAARTISLTGGATGSASFDGSKNIAINTVIPEYQGATDSVSGIAGLVPPATSTENNYALFGSGVWGEVVPLSIIQRIETLENQVSTLMAQKGL